ncbi:MAG: HAL/PAL/TAL family ammonia-lyase, partial [Burkholderiales bacterium]
MVETLIAMLNAGVHPVVPSRGSVGASGDLAPLAHLALVAIGEGEAFFKGSRMPGREAMQRVGIAPLALEAKEGLALLNGTQGMTAVGGLALAVAGKLAEAADVIGAMTLEALRGTPVAFDEKIHAVRPHAGQAASARLLRELIADSEIRESHRDRVADPRVQDAYALRCMPQVHGAVRDALQHARQIIEIEINSATDNPLVFAEEREVLSGGNFHGEPLGLALDTLAIGLAQLGGIAERRIDRLVNPLTSEGLPPFLSPHGGLHSGYMIAQYVAAALVGETKTLAHPASADSIPTSGLQEDYNAMGAGAALKARAAVRNVRQVLAIELVLAAQALDLRAPLEPGRGSAAARA